MLMLEVECLALDVLRDRERTKTLEPGESKLFIALEVTQR